MKSLKYLNLYLFFIALIFFPFGLKSQNSSNKFQISITSFNNSILEISPETMLKLKGIGFDFAPNYNYLGRNYSEHFDFNNDGFNDIVWIVPKNPTIGSPVLLFLWDTTKKKFVEQTSFFVLGFGDHMMYYDTVYDFDGDGDLDIYLPIENYHGPEGKQPSYYFPGGHFIPGNMFINEGKSLRRTYIDTTTVNYGKQDYPAYWQASLIDYDMDNKKDLIVPTINQRPDSKNSLAAIYSFDNNFNIFRKFVFPWNSPEMYKGQTHSMIFRNFNNKIYAFLQPKEDYPDGVNTFYYYTYPEVWIYNKSVNGSEPVITKKIELKRNLNLLNQGSVIYNEGFYISDLDNDGNEEFILGMFSLPKTNQHWAIHIFNKNGEEITDTWFKNKDYLESTGSNGNGFDLIDLNGDGKDDILPRDRFNSTDSQIPIFLNNGKFFEKHIITTNGPDGFNMAVDYNNDGIKEILKVSEKIEATDKFVYVYNLQYLMDEDKDGVEDGKDKCANTPAGTKVNSDGCELVLGTVFEPEGIRLIPNPTQDLLRVEFESAFAKEVQLDILDVLGRVVLSKNHYESGTTISLKSMNAGTYIVRLNALNDSGKSVHLKLIKF